MHFSPPKLHPPLLRTDEDRKLVRGKVEALVSRRPKSTTKRPRDGSRISIPLTTVAVSVNFDAFIQVQFPNPGGEPFTFQLLVDSGNTCLIVPHADMLNTGLYQFYGATTEPWGCPAYLLRGPVQLPTLDGGFYEIEDCVFYACYADNPDDPKAGRTANFGVGRVSPWPTVNMPPEVTVQSPLSYDGAYSFSEFIFAPAAAMLPGGNIPVVTDGSLLILNSYMPSGYTRMDIIPSLDVMSVVPTSLRIGNTETGWPGTVLSPIAMVDTGGGPAFLSDPNGYVYESVWPDTVACPCWTSSTRLPSQNCNCIGDRLQIGLTGSGNAGSYSYSIDTSSMPQPVQGLTAVMCQVNGYMMNYQGMNIGGLSMLFNRLLIEYEGMRVGLAPHHAGWPPTLEMSASINQAVAVSPSGLLIGYDAYDLDLIVNTTMTISWSNLPAGATLYVQHGGSEGAQVVWWSGPTSSTDPSGRLSVQFAIQRLAGAAVPVYISAVGNEYLPLNIQLTATTN